MKKTKVLLTLACAVLLVAASVMGTMAYLTSTDKVENTFTVGNVAITLDEAKVNANGQPIDKNEKVVEELANAERVDSNSYKLLPGHTYTKDPTVTVLEGSEESYVRLLVTVTFGKELTNVQLATKLDDIFTGYSSNWVRNGAPKAETKTNEAGSKYTVVTYEYRYNTTVSALNGDNKLPALFTGVTVPGDWTNNDLANIGGFTINIVGQAIQKDGFATADAAWTAYPAA